MTRPSTASAWTGRTDSPRTSRPFRSRGRRRRRWRSKRGSTSTTARRTSRRCSTSSPSSNQLDLGGPAAFDPEGGQVAGPQRQDQIRTLLPEPDVLDIGPGGTRGGREVRMEHRQLVAVVLCEPDLGVVELELETIRRRGGVASRLISLRAAVADENQSARLV